MSVNLGRVAYVEKGAYDSGTTYEKKDVVLFNGGSYVFIADTPAAGKQPTDTAYWQPLIDPAPMLEATANATEAAAAANEARQNIQKDLTGKAPAIFLDASGDVVQIEDGAEGMPVKSLITTIVPKEDGTGWEAVTVKRTGINILPNGEAEKTATMIWYTTKDAFSGAIGERITVSFDLYSAGGTAVTVQAYQQSGLSIDGSYTITPQAGTWQRHTIKTTIKDFGQQPGLSAGQIIIYSPGGEVSAKNVQVEFGVTATPFEPHNGQNVTAALPETVTNGSLDWVNGILTKDDGSTVQLTPQQLETLKGTNNIWSDAGETEVTYAADTKMYIDQKIAAIAAAIV